MNYWKDTNGIAYEIIDIKEFFNYKTHEDIYLRSISYDEYQTIIRVNENIY